MIALWLSAGLLAGQSEAPTQTIRRGDDAGTVSREWFWRKQAEEWLAERLEALGEAKGRPLRARKRLATRIMADVPEFVSEIPDLAPRVSALVGLAERIAAPAVDYSALAAAVAREMAIVAEWQKQQRRRRDMEALLVLAA